MLLDVEKNGDATRIDYVKQIEEEAAEAAAAEAARRLEHQRKCVACLCVTIHEDWNRICMTV